MTLEFIERYGVMIPSRDGFQESTMTVPKSSLPSVTPSPIVAALS
jgi:hypothetical protein